MREQLLAYLLGHLGPSDRQSVERALADSPELQHELEGMRVCLAAVDCDRIDDAPSGLAERTCRHVTVSAWSAGSLAPVAPGTSNRWRMADILVALGIALATAAFLLPALQQSRHLARRQVCENHLRKLGHAIIEFAHHHEYLIPIVPPRGKDAVGGIYSVQLADAGLMDREELIQYILCPASQLAVDFHNQIIQVRIPTRDELLAADGRRLDWFRNVIGGSYAYRIGYLQGHQYNTIRIRQTGRVPLMADAPSLHLADFQSANHAGCGQNVLFDDGHVRFLAHCSAPDPEDQLFKNRNGLRAAGCDASDTVLVASSISPAIDLALQTNE
ncbi:MAG: hypothetical protein JW829_06345 [Pirellulales bacterium]|nr:hypothetical protein [Pirellulales bacterium]